MGGILPHNGTRFEIDIDFDSALIGRQVWKGEVDADTFRRELARARTFGFMRDVERLWASGHALGSSLENSVVIGDEDKVINVEGLRFRDEFVRHKTLDAVGDLALAGARSSAATAAIAAVTSSTRHVARDACRFEAYEIVETSTRREHAGARGELIRVASPAFAPWAN